MPGADRTAELQAALERRVNRIHLQQRLGIEAEGDARVFGQGINFFHIENWYSVHGLMRAVLRIVMLHDRGRCNALRLRVTHNAIALRRLPLAFDGLRILHISDPHLDMNPEFPAVLGARVRNLEYDLAVITGDFRARTHGPWQPATEALRRVREDLRGPVFAVLGNHDSISMVPAMEALDIRVLLNECELLERRGRRLYLVGVDDPHYYRADSIEKAAAEVPADACSVLLVHSPEIYRHAAYAGFDLMLCGHTHGGQVCLPGGLPVMVNARCPRAYCRGSWRYRELQGYTSVGCGSSVIDVRFNCEPEVTLHTLSRC